MSVTLSAYAQSSTTPRNDPRTAGEPRRSWWRTALGAAPNLVVFAGLSGILYLGHHTGWRMPRLSQLTGAATIAADDWCTEHLVPESKCIECRTDLLPATTAFGFCQEHGVAECVLHHPELAQVKGDPRFPKYNTAQAIALVARPPNNSRNTLHTRRVQFASVESIAKSGIEVDVVQERPMAEGISANGELIFDPTRVAHLSSRVPGGVALVFKSLGDEVVAGEILAVIDSASVGQAKAQFLQALVQAQLRNSTVEQLRPLASGGAMPRRAIIEAEAALKEAEIALITARQALANLGFDVPEAWEAADPKQVANDLRFLGLSSSVIAVLPRGTETANLFPLRAPQSGAVIAADVVAGEVVEVSQTLFTLADPSQIWLVLNVRPEDARHVRLGLPVKFVTDDDPQEFTGTVTWISPAVDEQTRTLQVRVGLANSEGRLRAQTFGTGRIILREETNAVVVPVEALQTTSDAQFVFVRDKAYFEANSPKFFHVRQVRVGARDERYVELLAGALPGEVIAAQGSNVLLAQLLRANLGAGCGCHE
jgi:membrane fusion protein, heavy metal efflux system